ncbi:MAG: hypothetical protein COA73_02885 [Candidatus Hydrogenedentota bacterium]|nr:MAG: hypothetical protein COA73_02885 [Candidatus Hydrogenedentota bacterium]
MGSKQTYAILFLLLLASVAGTFAVFQFYVKERWIELGKHELEEEKLRTKIKDMEEKFFRTNPEAILELWRNKKQPWMNASAQRAEFFQFIPFEPTEPPSEGVIPKFYYKEEFPKLKQQLSDEAYNNGTAINALNFGVPEPSIYGRGTNPPVSEILQHMNRYKYGMEMIRLLLRAKVTSITRLEFWPPVTAHKGLGGDIRTRTTGYTFTIRMKDLVSLLDNMRLEDQYFNIEAIKITNQNLRDANHILNVEMVVKQAGYKPISEAEAASALTADGGSNQLLTNLFGGGLRRNATEPPKVSIFKKIMMLFPF